MLSHFLKEFNGYSRIQGGMLYDLFKNNNLVEEQNLDRIIGYIQNSSLEDTLLLIDPNFEHQEYAKRIIWLSWYTLHMEKEMEGLTLENCEAAMNQTGIKALLFGEMNYSEMEKVVLASEDDETEEVNEDEEDDSEDDDDSYDVDDEEYRIIKWHLKRLIKQLKQK